MKRILPFALLLSAFTLGSCLKDNPDYAAGVPSPTISIADVRNLYRGTDVLLDNSNLSGARQITGLVISDASGRNVPGGPQAVVVQNRRKGQVRGLVLPMPAGAPLDYAVGDSVVVDVTGARLTSQNGGLRIEGLSPANITKVSSGHTPAVQAATIEALRTSPGTYEATLVRVTGGNITPAPTGGATYSGDKNLVDGSGNLLVLHTEAAATFASRRVPASATFQGIPIAATDAAGQPQPQLWLRTIADVIDPSGPVYAGFPESFEGVPQATKGSYNMNTAAVPDNTVTFGTGPWKLFQTILGNTAGRDRYTGAQGLRMQQNLTVPAVVEMKFDLPNGASKVTLLYGAYYTDASSSWMLEYSQDQGATWKQTGSTITDAGNWQRSITFLMNIEGPVRFRISKLGLGTSNPPAILNGRLGLDDIAIYEN
ncbi:DUF5689 domain-containing protein [Hymenobacter aerilatus]|uniref:DUF5689 domain-containing protein n=1 Tax=Hymenobacter aerilatus TaxID=2932251 RepID=A0A8T9SYW8_9BACT|nr:DUF5689 domain-containing protein [Hymenobacter aerilatus]UOR04969.1 DUF5689 domain-containing protein [Hymenobacter aerilatus]